MGWFIRKSFGGKGPIRVNLSKSGIGLSFGVTGFRVGTGPRGQYVHAGRHGLYYRKQLGNKRTGLFRPEPAGPAPRSAQVAGLGEITHLDEMEITKIVFPETQAMVDAINGRLQGIPFALIPVILTFFLLVLVPTGAATAVFWLGAIATVATFYLADRPLRRTTIHYDTDEWTTIRHGAIQEGVASLAKAHVLIHKVEGRAQHDWKRNAGASESMTTKPLRVELSQPPYVSTNLHIPVLRGNKMGVCFMPKAVLTYRKGPLFPRYAAIPYAELELDAKGFVYIDPDKRPGDTERLEDTWEKVNRSGGRDRRFSSNRCLRRYKFHEITLSQQGFRFCMIVSSKQCSLDFARGLLTMKELNPNVQVRAPQPSPPPSPVVSKPVATLHQQALADRKHTPRARLRCPRCGHINEFGMDTPKVCTKCRFGAAEQA